jgi:iron complex transport system ATP-binding protein
MTPARLTVRDLAWGPSRHLCIIDAISFEVAPRQVVAIAGPNGAGKSSLLRCLYRMHRPWRGTVEVDGENVWRMAPREAALRIAAVPQEVASDFPFRVRDVVAMGRTPRRRPLTASSREDRAHVDSAIERLDLAHLTHRLFSTLSGGEKQRVLIARALAQQPGLIVLDEPTNHLDIRHQLEILVLLRTLDLTIVTTLHDLNLAAAFADRVLLIAAGRLVADGSPAEILTQASIRDVFAVESVIDRHPCFEAPRFAFHLSHRNQGETPC